MVKCFADPVSQRETKKKKKKRLIDSLIKRSLNPVSQLKI